MGRGFRRGSASGRWCAAVAVSALSLLGVGCASGADGSVVEQADPVCEAVSTLAGVWGTAAPGNLLGDAEALADFAAGLQGGFDGAVAVLADEAPPEVEADLEVVATALEIQYRDALAYAGGDMSAVPVMTPVERDALAGVEAWTSQRCPGVGW